jgi:hypothetical protein
LLARRSPIKLDHWLLLAALLLALLAAWPLLAGEGLLNTRGGGDSPFLLQRLHQLETALRDGHFPVRWMPDANYGYGYPFYHFYAPLSLYGTAVFRFLGFSYVGAIKAAQVAAFLLAAWGVFALARRWFGTPWAGLLAATAYTFAPFHMVNVYVRGDSLAEFWAMAFYPLVLLAADQFRITDYGSRITDYRTRRNIAFLALAYAGLILSHNISALIFSPFLLLYLALILIRKPPQFTIHNSQFTIHNSLPLLSALLLAFALSAWFFIPALAERDFAQLGPVTEGYFHFSNHFRGADLAQGAFFFDYGVDGGNAFRMGLAQAVTAVAGTVAIIFFLTQRRKEAKGQRGRETTLPRPPAPPLLFILTLLAVATLMITPLSRLLWEHLPLLDFTQFPWRFLSVQALGAALAVGALALLPGRRLIVPLLAVALAWAALGDLRPDFLPLNDGDVTAVRLAEYEWYTGNIGSTVSAEYLYPAVQPRPVTSAWLNAGERDRVIVLDGAAAAQLVERRATRQRWEITAVSPTTLIFPTMYWPGWTAAAGGQPITIGPSAGSGLIQLELPPGDHAITLRLARTPVRAVAEGVSGTAVLLVGWLFWGFHRKGAKDAKGGSWRWLAILLGAAGLLALGARLWPEPELPPGTLNWDFAQMAYLHHGAGGEWPVAGGGIPFDNGLVLVGYGYGQEVVAPGDVWQVALAWSSGAAGTPVTVALYSPAITRPPILAEVEPAPIALAQGELSESLTLTLTIPETAPVGLYVPRLLVEGYTAQTGAGLARGDLFLRPVAVSGGAGEMGGRGAGEMGARVVDGVVRADGSALDLALGWWTERQLGHNYNLSLRLTDAEGRWLRQLDTQPGFGFLPSSGWLAGQWNDDWLSIALPELDPMAGPYPLLVQLYDVGEAETAVLVRRLGQLVWEEGGLVFQPHAPSFALPEGVSDGGETAVFGETIALAAYALEQEADHLTLTLHWQALTDGTADFVRFVHLIDPAVGGPPLAQADSYPANNTYPTSQWTAGEIVTDRIRLDLTAAPPGQYALALGFYRLLGDGTGERITAVGPDDDPLPDNLLILGEVEIGD